VLLVIFWKRKKLGKEGLYPLLQVDVKGSNSEAGSEAQFSTTVKQQVGEGKVTHHT
jgi:hypothetical protein